MKQRSLKQSQAYLKRAEALIPAQTQTLSKGPTQFVQGVAPVFLQRGKGSHVWDVDGNEYIDLVGALGPVILGYAYPAVDKAIRAQLKDGISFSLPHPLEVEVAELLTHVVPSAKMVRFGKNGSDATSAAVRIARTFTGREKLAQCGYHGWQDWHIAASERNLGVPKVLQEYVYKFTYNHLGSLEKIFAARGKEIAAVIMEPITADLPKDNFLQKVKDLAHKHGALLIFDEVVTGFRVALGGAQEYFKVTPDLSAVGKAMANGMPISAVVGRRDVMKAAEDTFFSMTFGGETLSLAAAVATINEMKAKNVIAHLWKQGKKLQDGANQEAKRLGIRNLIECKGLPPKSFFTFKDTGGKDSLLIKSIFQQEVLKRGVLFNGNHALCLSLTDRDVEQVLEAYAAALASVKQAEASGTPEKFVAGRPLQPVFREV